MAQRFVSIWFRHLLTDWLSIRTPAVRNIPFVFTEPDHGRIVVKAASRMAQADGVLQGMALADARAIVPVLQVFDHNPLRSERLLKALALWCVRYTPTAGIDLPDGLLLDVTGCAHLWGGEKAYLTSMSKRLKLGGYDVRIAIADTIGTAWAVARFGKISGIVESGGEADALMNLPAAALRLPENILARLQKLGLNQVGRFITMPRTALRRRFGKELLLNIDQALGKEIMLLKPVIPLVPYQERLPCLEPIATATGIEIALQRLLESLCCRLLQEEKGMRRAAFKGYRMDGRVEEVGIGTNRPSCNVRHLFRLFEERLGSIEPDEGIELFVLEAVVVDDLPAWQQTLWAGGAGLEGTSLAELLDRVANRVGRQAINRYLPAEHYWPERSIQPAMALDEKSTSSWQMERPRPSQLLLVPQLIEVTAPVPDYPPMLFRYLGKLHKIKRADGPERIEREWWLEEGPHRDYYYVEDEEGKRYWLFRSGHYTTETPPQWFIHGFFA